MKFIGQHIIDMIARFRSDVYLDSPTAGGSDPDKFLGIDSDEDGVVDTDLMSRDEVVDMFEKVYDMSEIEANERADKSGAIKGNKKRIFEDEDIMNMLEVIINSKDEPKEIKDKEEDETDDSMLNRKIDQLKKYITSKGYSIEDVLKKLK